MTVRVIQGDCLEVMPTLEADSIDAIVCDPPYGLGFMGKAWDYGVPGVPFWIEAIRVVKPGAYLLAFGGTRTFHRLAVAIEDAGFEIQDCLSWLYGSGFPKHKSKLKPAWEPIIMARKPAPKATHLNIDACRIGIDASREGGNLNRQGKSFPSNEGLRANAVFGADDSRRGGYYEAAGRWPANVCLDEIAAARLDEMSGDTRSNVHMRGVGLTAVDGKVYGKGDPAFATFRGHNDSGGASRFFYTAKASRSERSIGLRWLEGEPAAALLKPRGGNHHPTVKPVDLMRWLVRLITPPNGVVLDPFMGSGTTGIAAVLESKRFIGIEKEAEYCAMAEKRIAHWGAQGILNLETA